MWKRITEWVLKTWRARATSHGLPPVESLHSTAFRARLKVGEREADELQAMVDQLNRDYAKQKHTR